MRSGTRLRRLVQIRKFFMTTTLAGILAAVFGISLVPCLLYTFWGKSKLRENHLPNQIVHLSAIRSQSWKDEEIDDTPKNVSFIYGNAVRCNKTKDTPLHSRCRLDWGWQLFESWLQNQKLVIEGDSTVNCAVNEGTFSFCKFNNVTIDFSRGTPRGVVRVFSNGFFTTHGKMLNKRFSFDIPGMHHIEGIRDLDDESIGLMEFDSFENRPSFIISNDDNFNLGHYINDVANVWQMTVLAGRNTKDSLLINVDGFRADGPAGGPQNRLMVPSDVDCYGPYISYFNSWFSEIKKAVYYRGERVKFAELYIPTNPYFPWFWNDWRTVSKCALESSSPLYQSFNLFLRNRWIEKYGVKSLPLPDVDNVHVVLELRPIDRNKTGEHSSARHIENMDALIAEMVLIPNTRVTAQDFTLLTFPEQVKLAHSAGVFVSMHGAGTTHIFHSALGAPNCCALVELQPEARLGYREIPGFSNLARMHGLHYYRYIASDGQTGYNGTTVTVNEVIPLIREAVAAVQIMPTCLGDVRDTREADKLGFKWL